MIFFLVKNYLEAAKSSAAILLFQSLHIMAAGGRFLAYGLVLAQDVKDWYYLFINTKSFL